MWYYSSNTKGFYTPQIHSELPVDAIEITDDEHRRLIYAQSQGKIIQSDENGYPIALESPPSPEPPEVELTQRRIAEIQQQLTANDLASVRPLRAKVAGTATAEDDARLIELEEQAQALRAELAEVSA